jgi:hypothetical protein
MLDTKEKAVVCVALCRVVSLYRLSNVAYPRSRLGRRILPTYLLTMRDVFALVIIQTMICTRLKNKSWKSQRADCGDRQHCSVFGQPSFIAPHERELDFGHLVTCGEADCLLGQVDERRAPYHPRLPLRYSRAFFQDRASSAERTATTANKLYFVPPIDSSVEL